MNPSEFAERERAVHPEVYAPGHFPADRAAFEEAVADALDAIPPEFTKRIENVAILIEDDPPPGSPLGLLGLYHGVPLTRRRGDPTGMLPDQITIYRNPILRLCRTRAEVVQRVAVTVVHEVGHYFGIDDARLRELGWA